MKKNSNKKNSIIYLKRLKYIGYVGIVFSCLLIGYDIYTFQKGWFSILSIIVDCFLLIFSIYFIIKSFKLLKIENKVQKK